MVKLNKIYTRTGDDGTTGLVTGARVTKACPRVCAYGDVDEANAAIGLAIVEASRPGSYTLAAPQLARVLTAIQHDMFDLGADLATPRAEGEANAEYPPLRIIAEQVERIESDIDHWNANLQPLTSFVLPGGSPLSAALHLARTTTRRAERAAVLLHEQEPEATSPIAIHYLNRLSDLLFVLCRVANDNGSRDVLWKPGANRRH
jgi:cob(I)alamin adenosyltransferase